MNRLSLGATAKKLIAALCLSCLGPFCLAQRGAITVPRDLNDLTNIADRIVEGTVIAARVEPDSTYQHLSTLLLSMKVDDVLKGPAADQLTLRQFVWDPRDIADAAGYRTGDRVLLFLNRTTKLGLISPVGLEQGKFHITTRNGIAVALNGNGNAGLVTDTLRSGPLRVAKLSASTRSTLQGFQEGPIPLSVLKDSVRALLSQNQAVTK